MATIVILRGDGIGPEVVDEGLKVLEAAARRYGITLEFQEALLGGAAIDATGDPLPAETLRRCREADAVLLGAVGGPKWDTLPVDVRPEQGLLRLRKALQLFANLRPVRLFPSLLEVSPLKRDVIDGTDLIIFRELTGGLYYGTPRGIERQGEEERGVDTLSYTTSEIARIARLAFQAAEGRRKKVTSVDKANVLMSSQLWRRVLLQVAQDFPRVSLEHMYVDNCAMQLVRNPRQFDVIVTENMFGDILSDEAAVIAGSIGLIPSASLGAARGLYEPIHGTAPDIVGTGRANPIGTILSAALLMRYSLKQEAAAVTIEAAVERVLAQGYRTPELKQPDTQVVGTQHMGDLIAQAIETA
ncbi:MAG: 3-isopropylmalate dehydrogenase [candidate division NC10 bacterium]|jgi:3-isopropylmalate dehydrogenase|nr:3-isopropylmalate dehydrogenase [candidate division NC10 bacterium]MCH7896014.1 3-isopropylmalate dehydrogenase [candidate division NC10 bacterium]MCZ6552093.1 3-isopropylmalate dehydrogenase [candidate division NC10 bacterium]